MVIAQSPPPSRSSGLPPGPSLLISCRGVGGPLVIILEASTEQLLHAWCCPAGLRSPNAPQWKA